MTLTIRLDTTSWSSPHAAPRPCTEPPSIMSGPGLLSFNLLRVWVSRVQGPGQPRPHDEMRCAAALHSDTALWETRYRYLHSIYYTIIPAVDSFPELSGNFYLNHWHGTPSIEGVKQTTLQTSCLYIFPACSVQCDHVTALASTSGRKCRI